MICNNCFDFVEVVDGRCTSCGAMVTVSVSFTGRSVAALIVDEGVGVTGPPYPTSVPVRPRRAAGGNLCSIWDET